eukprot:jgi/Bigna1/60589/fgenesh1_kg.13_\
MENMECAVDQRSAASSTLHVTGVYSRKQISCKIDVVDDGGGIDLRTISFRRIQGNSLAFQRFFLETSQAIWNR